MVPRQSSRFVLTEIDGEALLYDTAAHHVVYLNDSARLVWALCTGERDEADLVRLIAGAFPEAGDRVAGDVASALEHLLQVGAVEDAGSGSSR